ncbi:MAG: hypothetical protein AB7R40_03190 [Nitrospiraceae bacterium]
MSVTPSTVRRTLCSGTYAGLCMSAAIGLIGKVTIGTTAPPLNAISHILWGRKAAHLSNWSMKYTGYGLILNQLACLFWAGCYEALIDKDSRPGFSKAVAVSAVAYLTDYHLVPRRFTPGFEFVFPRRMFPYLYAALAISLVAGVRMRRSLER